MDQLNNSVIRGAAGGDVNMRETERGGVVGRGGERAWPVTSRAGELSRSPPGARSGRAASLFRPGVR